MWNAVDDLLNRAIEKNIFPGCAIAAGQRHEVLYAKTYGRLLRNGSKPVTQATRYDVGALTQVMATMPLTLAAMENGLISLDDSICRYVDSVPADKRSITLEQLLSHTSGLTASFSLEHEAENADGVLKAILTRPLEHQPGNRVRRCSMGYILLGFILEKVFGMHFDQAVKRYVTAPLGMKATGFLPSGDDIAPTVFSDENGQPHAGYPLDGNARFLHGIAGHAGLFTSLDDITAFASMLACKGRVGEGVVFAQRSIHLASTERTRGMNEARGYGFKIVKRSNPFLGHLMPSDSYGLQDAASGSLIAVNPSDGFFLAVLLNACEASAHPDEMDRMRKVLINTAYAAFQRG